MIKKNINLKFFRSSKLKLILFFILYQFRCVADDFHYKDVIIGERASGLGGSYIAISDDPSGLWYNPAGIIFSFENYFSLSANAYNETSEVYKNVFKNGNYSYRSKGLIPNFFGFTQTFREYKWGFAVIVPKSDLIDQDDEVGDISATAGSAKSLQRKFFRQNNMTGIGFGGASKIKEGLTVGISLFGMFRDEKMIDNQLIEFNADGSSKEKFLVLNTSLNRKTFSIYPKLGAQYMATKELSLGLTLSKIQHLSGETKTRSYKNSTITDGSASSGLPKDFQYNLSADLVKGNQTVKSFELSPLEIALGAAYFPSKKLMLTADLNYYSGDSEFKDFKTVDTFNLAIGTEYFLSDKKAIRLGVYTNNANTKQLSSDAANQAPHVDMLGVTASMTMFSAGSALSFGALYSNGKGKGQAVGDVTIQQDIERTSMTAYLTGSYQM